MRFWLNCCSYVRENCWLGGSGFFKKIYPSEGEFPCRRHISLASATLAMKREHSINRAVLSKLGPVVLEPLCCLKGCFLFFFCVFKDDVSTLSCVSCSQWLFFLILLFLFLLPNLLMGSVSSLLCSLIVCVPQKSYLGFCGFVFFCYMLKFHFDLYYYIVIIILYCHCYYFNGEFNPISLCLCTDIFYLLLKHTDTLPHWLHLINLQPFFSFFGKKI